MTSYVQIIKELIDGPTNEALTETLRDRFAGLAMQSLLARELAYEVLASDLADRAYEVADAMMAAREPREFLKD